MSKRARVLVVDDDPLFRSLIVSLLRKDYLVSVSSDGSEGFYKALEHPPDIAIIDIRMPGWDGLRTLRAFRSHPSLNRVKAVMLTSDASKESVLAAIHGGANDYIIKTSFSKAEFYQKLEKLVPATAAIQRRDGAMNHQYVESVAPPEPRRRRSQSGSSCRKSLRLPCLKRRNRSTSCSTKRRPCRKSSTAGNSAAFCST
jgi:CheY-like chemotaxis protein